MEGILLQCIHVSNHHVVHTLYSLEFNVSVTPQAEKKTENESEKQVLKPCGQGGRIVQLRQWSFGR